MKVTHSEVALILKAGRRITLLPAIADQAKPHGRQRFHRYRGPLAGYVRITHAIIVGPLDEYVDDDYARKAGHVDAGTYRDEWCRTHWTDWTGQQAWEVTFTLEPHREGHNPMRGPWDPGADDRRRAPEPEKVNGAAIRAFTEDARAKWARDQAQREALYRAMPLADRVAMAIRDARDAGVDTTLLEKSIERRVESLRSKTRKAA